MSGYVNRAGTPKNLTATGSISLVAGSLLGFYVNSTTAGTIVIRDGSGGTVLSGTITPAIGWHSFPAACVTGCHFTIGGTLDVTGFFAAG